MVTPAVSTDLSGQQQSDHNTSNPRFLSPQPSSSSRTARQPRRTNNSSRTVTAVPTGSTTQTITPSRSASPDSLVLRLRGAHNASSPQPRLRWASDVVDNEGLGRKKSKVCCIFHKTRAVGESSDESSSDSDSNSDSGSGEDSDFGSKEDDGAARMAGGKRHHHERSCGHGQGNKGKRKPSPNAYERVPKYTVKPLGEVEK